HPMTEMGCTICHRGAGEALDFIRADHRPTDETEGDEWNDEQHWHKQHHWDYPMLSSEMVEASCVQCHQDTMELIAEDAPEVTEGYRLFERYGCYSCHKVDWYPTKRRPGPSLTGIRQKAEREFIDAWVAKPKAFRPTTWMPQVFHLSNYSPETVIATSEYGQGRQIMGDEWSDSAIAAVSEFIWNRADDLASPAIPVEGDALRGQEVFQLVGCLACHNMAPFGEEERADIQASVEALSYSDYDLGEIANESNEHGPNLRGVATKVSREWLFAWIKDPSGYWSETRMPNLRLSDQEAADIVAYIFADPKGVFTETPEGWVTGKTPYKRDVLEEQARWFFNRELPAELDRRFAEEWADDTVLLEALGEKFVLAQGCHSCHEINGLENEQPIGTELSTWGSKTVDKLDWGLMHEFIAEERGLEGNHAWHFKQQLRSYREPWLDLKLENPRVFDREKFKNPTERLRMPYFGFDEAQRLALATFVVGLVEDEVSRARMVPSAAQQSMDTGLRAIRQNNCAACHVIEPGTIDFTDSDGAHRSVQGQYLAFEGEAMPPSNVDIHGAIANYEAFIQEVDEDPEFKVEDIAIQLLRPEPGVGEAGSLIVLEDIESLSSTPAWGGDFVNLVAKHYLYAFGYDENDEEISLTGDPDREGRVQDADGEWRYYGEEPFDKIRWTFAPPVLVDEGVKLQRDWFFDFLVSPYPLRQQLRVRMPTFTWNEGEAGAVADYFAQTASQDWPARYARKLLLEQGIDPAVENDSADKGLVAFLNTVASGGHGSISPSQLRGILMGDKVSTAAQFAKLKSYGDAIGFSTYGANDPAYESIAVNQPATIDAILAAMPDYLNRVHRLSADGPNCFQCHFLQGTPPVAEGPIAWAPDLDNTRSRLRPDWVREWLTDPLKIYPGTAMPANFPLDAAQWQDIWEAPSEEQIEAVTTWLFNLDRWAIRN
ncbi:MAG: cytochrome c2, partial [Planctomycetota bacterium]